MSRRTLTRELKRLERYVTFKRNDEVITLGNAYQDGYDYFVSGEYYDTKELIPQYEIKHIFEEIAIHRHYKGLTKVQERILEL